MLSKPSSFRLRERGAKRALGCQSRPLQDGTGGGKLRPDFCATLALGHGGRERHQETQAVLQVVDLGLPHQPRPVEIGVGHEHPDEPLDDARVQIRRTQAAKHHLGGIPAFAAPRAFGESVVAEGRQGANGAGSVEGVGVGRDRQRRWRHVEHAHQRFGKWRGHATCASLEQTDVPLRHVEASREFGLRPLTGGPGALQLEAGHGSILHCL